MTKTDPCPKYSCGFWGIPLEKLKSLEDIPDEMHECCLWHEEKEKCSRNPRFLDDPDAEDYFDPAFDEIQDEQDN